MYAVAGSLFCFFLHASSAAQLRIFSLLKPFLTFKSHIASVLIAQNEAKASINDLYAYYFAQKPFVYSYFRLEDILPTT